MNKNTIFILLNQPQTVTQKMWLLKNELHADICEDKTDLRYQFYKYPKLIKFYSDNTIKMIDITSDIDITKYDNDEKIPSERVTTLKI